MQQSYALMTSAIALALCTTSLPTAQAQQKTQDQQEQQQEAQQQSQQQKIDIATWDQSELYEGFTADQLMDTAVYGENDEDIGEIENLIIGSDGKIQKIVVEAGGIWDIGDTHFAVPWDDVKLGDGLERVTVPVNEENVQDFSLFGDEVENGQRAFRATELMHDYVTLQNNRAYGMVQDLVFGQDGSLKAVLVYPDVGYGVAGGPYAYPYHGYEAGFDPGMDRYELPYAENDIAKLGPFDYSALDIPMPAAGPAGQQDQQTSQ